MTASGGHRSEAVRILGISGSLRAGSSNTLLLRAMTRLVGPDARLDVWPGLDAIPLFTEDAPAQPEAVRALVVAAKDADALLFATPEYNFSVPGVLKNAIDWASHPPADGVFSGRPVAVVGASVDPTSTAEWARADLRRILGGLGASVVERDVFVARADRVLTRDGRLRDPAVAGRLTEVVRDLCHRAGIKPTAADRVDV